MHICWHIDESFITCLRPIQGTLHKRLRLFFALLRDYAAELKRRKEEKSLFLQDIDRVRSSVDTGDRVRRNTLLCKKARIKK